MEIGCIICCIWPLNIPTFQSTGFTPAVLMSMRILPGSGFGEWGL